MATEKAQSAKVRAVIEFTGTFERTDDGLIFAVCGHAPLVAQGDNEDDALEHMKQVIRLYLGSLKTIEQINAAVDADELRVRLLKPETSDDHPAQKRPPLKIVKRDDGFKAQAELDDIAA